jgi:hypothetical protein
MSSSRTHAAFVAARQAMVDLTEEWCHIPARTAEVGDYVERLLAAEVRLLAFLFPAVL